MPTPRLRPLLTRALAGVVLLASPALAQEANASGDGQTIAHWLAQDPQQQGAASGETFRATTSPVATDPFAVLTSGALWQETYGEFYSRKLNDAFSLSCQTSDVVFDEDAQAASRAEQAGLQFAPVQGMSLGADAHGSETDAAIASDSTTTTGVGLSASGRLPTNAVLSLGVRFDRTSAAAPSSPLAQTRACDAQLLQPLGQLPLSAVFKTHLEGTAIGTAPATSLPSLEQSLVWKPLADTTVQMGLRQQQYQEYPGVDHELNEALFADWSQKLVDNVSWHSYAELLNSKGLLDQAPASPVASGANGTPQATAPGANASLTSSMPLSIEDQTVTFSTGPSFQLQKDISASLEYSNRWDKNPAPGSIGQEQRVSVSLKGTF